VKEKHREEELKKHLNKKHESELSKVEERSDHQFSEEIDAGGD